MDLVDVGKLLAVASAYDNRQLREETAIAWKAAIDLQLPELDARMAAEIVVWWFSEPRGEYFAVGHLIGRAKDLLRVSPAAVAADVRSARARGLIDASWDERSPLPGDVREALRRAREGDVVAAAEIAARPAGGNALPQLVTKRVPA